MQTKEKYKRTDDRFYVVGTSDEPRCSSLSTCKHTGIRLHLHTDVSGVMASEHTLFLLFYGNISFKIFLKSLSRTVFSE